MRGLSFILINVAIHLVLPLNSVIKNIAHLCGRTRSKTWGPEGWKRVVVCIVSDGRSKVNKRTLQVLSLVCNLFLFIHLSDYHLDGMLPRGHRKRFSRRKGCHRPYIRVRLLLNSFSMLHIVNGVCFRYTTNVIVTDTGEVSASACPVQILFCLKEQNKKKLNSHRWFFNAFGPLLQPNGAHALYVPACDGVDFF